MLYIGPWQEMKLAQLAASNRETGGGARRLDPPPPEAVYRIFHPKGHTTAVVETEPYFELDDVPPIDADKNRAANNERIPPDLANGCAVGFSRSLASMETSSLSSAYSVPLSTRSEGSEVGSRIRQRSKRTLQRLNADPSGKIRNRNSHTRQMRCSTNRGGDPNSLYSSATNSNNEVNDFVTKPTMTSDEQNNTTFDYNERLINRLMRSSRNLPCHAMLSFKSGHENEFSKFWKWTGTTDDDRSSRTMCGKRTGIATANNKNRRKKESKRHFRRHIIHQMKEKKDLYSNNSHLDHRSFEESEELSRSIDKNREPHFADAMSSEKTSPVKDIEITSYEIDQVASYFGNPSTGNAAEVDNNQSWNPPKMFCDVTKDSLSEICAQLSPSIKSQIPSKTKHFSSDTVRPSLKTEKVESIASLNDNQSKCLDLPVDDESMSMEDLLVWAGNLDVESLNFSR